MGELPERAAAKRVAHFGVVSDVHYADAADHGSRKYRQSPAKLREALDVLGAQDIAFLAELGDFKDMDKTRPWANVTEGFIDTIEAQFQLRLNGSDGKSYTAPRYHVLGNHDEDCISKEQFLAHVHSTGVPDQSKSYAVDVGEHLHLVWLDGNYGKDGQDLDASNIKWNELYVADAEIAWLERDLAKAHAAHRNSLVFIHERLDNATSAWGIDCTVKNAVDVRHVLDASKSVLAVFHGHDHEAVQSPNQINGTLYVTLKGMIEGDYPEHNAYATVSVYDDCSVDVRGYRTMHNATLSGDAVQATCFLGA